MAYDLDELEAAVTPAPAAKQGGYDLDRLDQSHALVVDQLAKDKSFSPEQYASQFEPGAPEYEIARQVNKMREERPFIEKVKDINPLQVAGSAVEAGKTIAKGAAGLALAVPHAAYGAGNALGAGGARIMGFDDAADEYEKSQLTNKTEAIVGLQKGEQAASSIIGAPIQAAGRKAMSIQRKFGEDQVDRQVFGDWLENKFKAIDAREDLTPEQKDEAKAHFSSAHDRILHKIKVENGITEEQVQKKDDENKFDLAVKSVKNAKSLSEGRPIDEGLVAAVAQASEGGDLPSKAFAPEVLKAEGARPVSQLKTDMLGAAADPSMLAFSVAPAIPGAAKIAGSVTEGAGKALGVIPKLASKKTVLGTAAAYGLYSHNPVAAAIGGAGGALASGVSKWVGDALEQQGKQMAKGEASALSQMVAEGRATGSRSIGNEAKMLFGDTVANSGAAVVGMAPLNAMLADGDPQKFLDSEAGASVFGGALSLMHSNRPMMVQAIRPMLNREGAASIDTSSTWGKKSAEYIDTLPQDQKDAILETMGALNRIPGQNNDGRTVTTKIIPLDANSYAEAVLAEGQRAESELKKLKEENPEMADIEVKSAESGGAGFFVDKNGTVFINGDAPAHSRPGEVVHTIGHEAGGHAAMNILAAMGERGSPLMDGLMKSAKEGLMKGDKPTPEFQKFIDSYNDAFDPSGKTKAIDASDPRAMGEFIAEQAGQIISAEGPGELVLPKTLTDKLSDSVGGFVSSMLGIKPGTVGTPTKFDRTEVAGLTSVLRNTLSDIAQSKYRDGNVDMSMGDRSTEVLPRAKVEPKVEPVAPVEESAPEPPSFESRMESVGVDPATHDSARDFHVGDPSEVLPVRANTKKGIPGKSREQVIAEKEKEWDDMFSDLVDYAESVGASLPSDPVELHQIAIAHALGADLGPSSIDRRSGLPRRPSPKPVEARIPEPREESAPIIVGGEVIKPAAEEASAPVEPRARTEAPQEETQKPQAPVAPITRDAVEASMSAAEEAVKSDPSFARKKKESTRQDAIKTARVTAVLDEVTNHSIASGDEGLLQRRGEKLPYYSGRIDPSIPSHRVLLDELGVKGESESNIENLSNSIGKLVFVDYGSAPKETVGETKTADLTGKQRGKEYRQSTTLDRKTGGETFEQGKAFVPVSFQVFPGKKSVTVKGFSPDKLLSNLTKLFNHAGEAEIPTGYRGVNDPQIVGDITGYAQNHANGWQGDGAAPIKDGDVAPTPGYEPHLISADRFDILNAAFQGARPISPGEKGAETQALAEANARPVDPDTGDTNPFRAMVDKSGRFKTSNEKGEIRTGSKEMLEEVYENLDPGLIRGIREDRSDNDASVRPTEFSGDIREMMAGGRPKQGYVNAAFMPNEKGGLSSMKSVNSANEETAGNDAIGQVDRKIGISNSGGSQRSNLESAEAHIGGGERPSGSYAGSEARKQQKESVVEWAKENGILIDEIPEEFTSTSDSNKGGQEHDVFHDEDSGRWIKIARNFGMFPDASNGILGDAWGLRSATPKEYIDRLKLSNDVFGDDFVLHGIVNDGDSVRPIVSQPDIAGETLTKSFSDRVRFDKAMERAGFEDMGNSAWYRAKDNVAIFDLHEENAVIRDGKIHPIDAIVMKPGKALKEALISGK